MNGRTKINAALNPCSADVDKHTYGCRLLNFTTRGKRWLKVGCCGICVDLYPSGWHRLMYARYKNGATVFFPGGSLSWPMPVIRPSS